MSLDAMKQALEALIDARRSGAGDWSSTEDALRLAIEQAEAEQHSNFQGNSKVILQAEQQEPVAWVRWDDEENYYDVRRTPPTQENIDYLAKWNRPAWVPAYPHPPRQEKQEPVAWKNAAIRLGEELSSVGPNGYYDMSAEQWLEWAMDQQPRGKNSLPAPPQRQPHELLCVCGASWSIDGEGNEELLLTPPQRQPLTEEEIDAIWDEEKVFANSYEIARAIERAHGIGGGE